jgi:hypothetical protein
VPIPAGSTSATIDFTADDWYTQSAGLWAEGMKAHPQSLGPAAGRAVRPKERAIDLARYITVCHKHYSFTLAIWCMLLIPPARRCAA